MPRCLTDSSSQQRGKVRLPVSFLMEELDPFPLMSVGGQALCESSFRFLLSEEWLKNNSR